MNETIKIHEEKFSHTSVSFAYICSRNSKLTKTMNLKNISYIMKASALIINYTFLIINYK